MIAAATPRIEIHPPRLFTRRAFLAIHAYNLLLVLPLLLALFAVSLVRLGFLTFLLPVTALLLTGWFLPVGLGNIHITRLVGRLTGATAIGIERRNKCPLTPA